MGNLIINSLDELFQKCIQTFFEPLKELFGFFTVSPEIINSFIFINIIYDRIKVVAVALMILIVAFQSFKVKFSFLGFECEESWRIFARAIVFGFLIFYSKDISMVGVDLFDRMINFMWSAYYTTVPDTKQFVNLVIGMLIPGANIFLFSWSAIMFIYLVVKFIKLAFKFAERLMLTVLLVMISPLAFAAGTSQVTKGFLQGWVKLFTGNLIIQLLQVTLFIAMVIYRATDPNLISLYSFVIVVAIIKVLEKLEDIVRDASINVGVGRDMTSALNKVQSVIYTTTQTTQVINAAKMVFAKGS